jgi:hypothetical protein
MKLTLKAFAVFVLLATIAVSASALPGREALVVIRFNQQQVMYQDQLYNAVVQAVRTKPSVIFNVIGVAPVARDRDVSERYMQNTRYYAQKIADDLVKMGVNPQQVSFNVEASTHVQTEEVQIFVQ